MVSPAPAKRIEAICTFHLFWGLVQTSSYLFPGLIWKACHNKVSQHTFPLHKCHHVVPKEPAGHLHETLLKSCPDHSHVRYPPHGAGECWLLLCQRRTVLMAEQGAATFPAELVILGRDIKSRLYLRWWFTSVCHPFLRTLRGRKLELETQLTPVLPSLHPSLPTHHACIPWHWLPPEHTPIWESCLRLCSRNLTLHYSGSLWKQIKLTPIIFNLSCLWCLPIWPLMCWQMNIA